MIGSFGGGILDRKEHGPNPRIMQITTDKLLAAMPPDGRQATLGPEGAADWPPKRQRGGDPG
jgi:hypothetical protein